MKKIETKDFLLRPYRESDKEEMKQIDLAPDLMELVGWDLVGGKFSDGAAEEWYEKKTNPEYTWAIEVDKKLIGSVWIHTMEEANRSARYAIEIYNRDYWNKGLGKKITSEVVRFCFEKLRLHRLDLRVLTNNARAISCYESCGFRKEGIQRDTLLMNDSWFSDLWMSILEEEYFERKLVDGGATG